MRCACPIGALPLAREGTAEIRPNNDRGGTRFAWGLRRTVLPRNTARSEDQHGRNNQQLNFDVATSAPVRPAGPPTASRTIKEKRQLAWAVSSRNGPRLDSFCLFSCLPIYASGPRKRCDLGHPSACLGNGPARGNPLDPSKKPEPLRCTGFHCWVVYFSDLRELSPVALQGASPVSGEYAEGS